MASQTVRLFRRELKHKVRWKTASVALDGSIQRSRFHAIKICQVLVKHDLMAPDYENPIFDYCLSHRALGHYLFRPYFER